MTRRIHIFPAWEKNPYLNMLTLGARVSGWQVEGSKGMDGLTAAIPGLGRGDIFHIHWTSPVLGGGKDRALAVESLSQFASALSRMSDAGVRILWTVHNTLAHDAPFPDLEVEVARLLAERADRIIQLNRSTRDAVSEYYELPSGKLATIPHASYAGMYSEPPSPQQARQRLGIPADAPVVGFVGQIRAYKGIPTLLQAVERVGSVVEGLVLVLAGKTSPEDVLVIEENLPEGVEVVRDHSFISDGDLATWFTACDVMVFPYERVLNSGSVLLSATFGRPCILPAEPHLVSEFGDQPWVSFYDPNGPGDRALAELIPAALGRSRSMRAAARSFAANYTTYHMAWDYLALIEDVVLERRTGGIAS